MTHRRGTFVWLEHFGDDQDRAIRFYTEVFPWQATDWSAGEGMAYKMIALDPDSGIGGFMKSPAPGVPSHWLSYLSVEDVDASARRVEELGGKRMGEPFDIPGVGRICPVADPQGAPFALFAASGDDPSAHDGPGSWHWKELWTSDVQAALRFYEEAFGLKHEQFGDSPYFVLSGAGGTLGGVVQSPGGVPPNWLPFVTVDDADATAKRAEANGGSLTRAPDDMPQVGRFGILQDPLGATIGFIKPAS